MGLYQVRTKRKMTHAGETLVEGLPSNPKIKQVQQRAQNDLQQLN